MKDEIFPLSRHPTLLLFRILVGRVGGGKHLVFGNLLASAAVSRPTGSKTHPIDMIFWRWWSRYVPRQASRDYSTTDFTKLSGG